MNSHDFFAKGTEREVYRHPDNPKLCIKVTYNQKKSSRKLQNIRDFNYYSLLLRRNICWHNLAACHGWIETNLGAGLAFDFVADETGRPCKRLSYYRDAKALDDEYIAQQLKMLRDYCLENLIIVGDITLDNIVYCPQHDQPCKLILVDGVGNSDVVSFLTNNIAWLARKKIKRKWSRFLNRVSN